jgi:hypothetical protein
MPNHSSFSILLSALLATGCGASGGVGSSVSEGSTTGTTTSAGSGGSTGSAIGAGGSTGSTTSTMGSAGAGGSTGSTTGTTGAYTMCAEGLQGPDGDVFLDEFGVEGGAYLTVTPEGATLAATFVDLNGHRSSFTFDPTTGTSAVLAPAGAAVTGFAGTCVYGPGDTEFFPATVTATAGALEYTGSTMFLALTGTIGASDPGACSTATAPANAWIICGVGDGFPPVPPDAGAPVPDVPVGTYTCSSQIGTYDETGGLKEYVTAGGTSGTLTVTQSGAKVTAAYTGDKYASGTLDLTVATPTSAHVDPGQRLLAPCLVPFNTMGPQPPSTSTPEPLAVGAGALVWVDDTTLFLMLSGSMTGTQAMSSSCPGAVKMGSLVCTKQ